MNSQTNIARNKIAVKPVSMIASLF